MQIAMGLVAAMAMAALITAIAALVEPEVAEKLAALLMAKAAATRASRSTYAKLRRMDIRMVDPEAEQYQVTK